MEQSSRAAQSNKSKIKRYRSYGFARASLIIFVFSLIVWLVFLLPAALVSASSSALDVVRLFQFVFLVLNFTGVIFAIIALFKSKFQKELGWYGVMSNILGITINLALFSIVN